MEWDVLWEWDMGRGSGGWRTVLVTDCGSGDVVLERLGEVAGVCLEVAGIWYVAVQETDGRFVRQVSIA